jgi:hypothetical protein
MNAYLLLVWVAVRVLKLSVQKCLNVHFFIYFRRVYLLLVCVALRVLKSTVQKCLNIHFFIYLKYIKKWTFKHFCTDNFNTRTATQTRSKYTSLKYIKKWMFKHFCTVVNIHFFIYFRRLYLLLVCVTLRVLKSTVQKCLNVDFNIFVLSTLTLVLLHKLGVNTHV